MKNNSLVKLLDYKKLAGDKLKVIIINSGYFLIREFSRALVEDGNKIKMVNLYDEIPSSPSQKSVEECASANFLETLISNLLTFKPDFIFTVNLIGFDKDGSLAEVLDELNVIVVNWFVDTPFGILHNVSGIDKKNILSLCWEKQYIQKFRDEFQNHKIEYLPYGTMFNGRERFRQDKFVEEISFVGSSMVSAVTDWKKKGKISSVIEKEFTKLAEHDICNLHKTIDPFFHQKKITNETDRTYLQFLGSMLIRQQLLKNLDKKINCLTVYGDQLWQESKFINTSLKSAIDYYRELPVLYRNSTISLNFTSPQMKTAVNQRVFDVAGAGGFLLTDNRSDINELFGEDCFVVFESEDELVDKSIYYLKNEKERIEKKTKIQKIILSNHRYTNRITDIVELLKKHFN